MSKRVNWKQKMSEIPSRVQLGPKVFYDIVWQSEIKDTKGNKLHGLTDLTNKLIIIEMNQPARITVETYLHELTHAYSEEYNLGLTEPQVLDIEKGLPYLLKKGNVFKDE